MDPTDEERDEWISDERFLDFADTVRIGAAAIREKRRLLGVIEQREAEIARLRELLDGGEKARAAMLGDMVACFTTGALKVDHDAPIPEHMRAAVAAEAEV